MTIHLPLPLAGRGQGWGCKLRALRFDPIGADADTPTPDLSPQGGEEMILNVDTT
jgi:hypothetical protein